MFTIESVTSWSRYQANLNSSHSKFNIDQTRPNAVVHVRAANETEQARGCVVALDFLDPMADAVLSVGLHEGTAFKVGEQLATFMRSKSITVGNDDRYVSVDE
tara:strand:- start:9 stop:317 length:309 start_codon:yes stop_codon:yes gene_type:complete